MFWARSLRDSSTWAHIKEPLIIFGKTPTYRHLVRVLSKSAVSLGLCLDPGQYHKNTLNGLPGDSYVVLFWVFHYRHLIGKGVISKKELHRSLQVGWLSRQS